MAQHVMEARKNYGHEKDKRNIDSIVCEVNDNFPLVQLPLTNTVPTTSKMVQMRAWLKTDLQKSQAENDSVPSTVILTSSPTSGVTDRSAVRKL